MLVLVDLNAVFDTIDHNILLNHQYHTCGIQGTVLN